MLRSQSIKVFSGLSVEECAEVEKKIAWTTASRKTVLIVNDELSDDVYFLAQGSVRATVYSVNGREISYQDLGPGEMFGELSAIDGKPRTTSIVAVTDVVVGKVSSDVFWRLLEKYPSVMRQVVQRVGGLVRFLVERVYEFAALDVKDRVRAEVIRMCREHKTGENCGLIPKMPTHEAMANKIVTHREAVTKELNKLVKEGFIMKDGKSVTVPDLKKLEALLPEEI